MESQPRDIELYVTPEGKVPFSEWLKSLKDSRARAIVRARLIRVRLGNLGDCRSVGNGVFELRIDFGSGFRVYFGQEGNDIVVLLCGGDKGSQEKDIRKAKEYWSDYRSRENAEK